MDTLKNIKSKITAENKDVLDFINAFVDDKSFVETDAFMCSGDEAGNGVISGFATVSGESVCVFAINAKKRKGGIGESEAKKIVRTVQNAVNMGKPLIAVWNTSGAVITDGVQALTGYYNILRAFAVAYDNIPVISVVNGNNLGMLAYVSGVSDFVIAFENSVLASASPTVLAAKNGVDAKAVGCVKQTTEGGIVSNVVKNNKELKDTIVKLLAAFGSEKTSGDDLNRACKGLKAGVKVQTIVKEVFDKNSFIELYSAFAKDVIVGLATLGDIPVGVVATDSAVCDGRLTADGCLKINTFMNVCENTRCPVVFLTDCVGTEQTLNDTRLIREMSDMLYNVNTSKLYMFSVVYGKAIGSAYTALVAPCDYKIAWENAEVGALESESAARLLFADEIKSAKAKDKDKTVDKLAAEYSEKNGAALVVSKYGYFDNVVEPNLTRSYLIAALLAHVE